MPTIQEQIAKIIQDLKILQTNPEPYRNKNDEFSLPRMIGAGNGRSIIVSAEIDTAIATIADQLMGTDPTLRRRFTRAEWVASVRQAFGPPLALIDLDINPSTNALTVLKQIKTTLDKQTSDQVDREYVFGCTLFGNTAVQPFRIGPVRFEGRLDWLDRKQNDGGLSNIALRRIEETWSGKPQRKRKPSYDNAHEKDILEAISNCPFVCSVTTSGLAAEAGREKALTAARLAMAAIALLWRTPSHALEGMNLVFDRLLHSQTVLTFIPGKVVLAGRQLSHMPEGPWMKNGEWERQFAQHKDHFNIAGEILEYVVDSSGNVSRPNMMAALTQSMLWFHEGCRETVNPMAIVKYSSALDALACGKQASGIRKLITARLGIQDNSPIRPNGPTLKQAIEKIYSDGRSRTVHGTNSKLGDDWTGMRGLAEQFARLCLGECLVWAATNPSSDTPSDLSL